MGSMMEVNDLRNFQRIAATCSMSQATRTMEYAQSNLTERIKLLKQELSVLFFLRTNRGVVLLSKGEKLLKYATVILAQINEIETYYKKMMLGHNAKNHISASRNPNKRWDQKQCLGK
ncbi:hypothetical protein IGJ02_003053 [Enterococcus sp. DIV0724b]